MSGSHTIGFVTAAVVGAVSSGLLVITGTVLAVDTLRSHGSPNDLDLPFYLLTGGTLLGIMLASLVAWWLLAPISSVYRRGGLSIVSAFATIPLMLVSIPLNQLLGRTGLFLLLGLTGLCALGFVRRARRIGTAA
ncbi:MAG TPA: hypothetical protein VIM84_05555 [Gemmatimonadales bacterium]